MPVAFDTRLLALVNPSATIGSPCATTKTSPHQFKSKDLTASQRFQNNEQLKSRKSNFGCELELSATLTLMTNASGSPERPQTKRQNRRAMAGRGRKRAESFRVRFLKWQSRRASRILGEPVRNEDLPEFLPAGKKRRRKRKT